MRIPKEPLVSGAGVNPTSVRVYNSNQFFRIFADQPVQLFALVQLTAHPLNFELLIDYVEIEQDHQGDQATYGLMDVEGKMRVRLLEKIGERSQPRGQQQGHDNCGCPKP